MLPIVLTLVVVAAPAEPSRASLLDLMANQPVGFCGTRNPWVNFVFDDHSAATNALLMTMADDASLSLAQRSHSLSALRHQHADAAVAAFMRRRFADAPPGTVDRRVAGLYLVEHDTEARELAFSAFDTGDAEFDEAALLAARNSARRVKTSPATIGRLEDFYRRTKHPALKAKTVATLVSLGATDLVGAVLRSKDKAQLDGLGAFSGPASNDDLLEGLAHAGPYGRAQLENVLALQLVRGLRDDVAEALAAELLSAERRVGLKRAPLVAFVLGTWAEGRGQLDRATSLYGVGEAATKDLLAEGERDRELDALLLAFRAQRVNVLMKQKRRDDARELAVGLRDAVRGNADVETVLGNFTANPKVSLSGTAWRLEDQLR